MPENQMKKIIITLMLIAGAFSISLAQSAKLNADTSISYLNNTFKKGQQVQLFYGSGANKDFEFVILIDTKTYHNENATSDLSKRIVNISQVYFVGNKAFIRGRNDDDTDIVIDVEGAIDNKEIVAPNNVIVAAPVKKSVKKKI